MRNRKAYGKDWSRIRVQILLRDEFKCQFCGKPEGAIYSRKGKPLRLQVMHLDGNPENNHMLNLIAGCPKCHLKHDIEHGLRRRRTAGRKIIPLQFI